MTEVVEAKVFRPYEISDILARKLVNLTPINPANLPSLSEERWRSEVALMIRQIGALADLKLCILEKAVEMVNLVSHESFGTARRKLQSCAFGIIHAAAKRLGIPLSQHSWKKHRQALGELFVSQSVISKVTGCLELYLATFYPLEQRVSGFQMVL